MEASQLSLEPPRTHANGAAVAARVRLDLCVTDPEVVSELLKHADGRARDEFALCALRLGVLALRQASGAIDAAAVRSEGDRLLSSIGTLLTEQLTSTRLTVSEALKRYFDPSSGELPQRLERLVRSGGEIESLLVRHLHGDTCTVAQTLARHVGEQSPLLRLLSPNQSDGVLAAITRVIDSTLATQRDQIVRQFSLDDKDSALSRLVGELTGANGRLRDELSKNVSAVCAEFSLDNEQGALSRLVSRVENAQKLIANQFSTDNQDSALCKLSKLLATTHQTVEARLTLDDDASPLARLRRELLTVVETLSKANHAFQTEVRETLAGLAARRAEADRSTRHGGEFEDALGGLLQQEAQRLGDVFEAVGATTGEVPRSKLGDHVISLGPESAAPGARIVVEAKERADYTLAKALAEIDEARRNRDAQAGLFVFSKRTAPAGIEPLVRHGMDVVVVWDRDEPVTDIFVRAACSVARAMVVRRQVEQERSSADINAINRAVEQIARDADIVDQIATHAVTVQNSGKSIVEKAQRVRDDLHKQIESLREHVDSLRPSIVVTAA